MEYNLLSTEKQDMWHLYRIREKTELSIKTQWKLLVNLTINKSYWDKGDHVYGLPTYTTGFKVMLIEQWIRLRGRKLYIYDAAWQLLEVLQCKL